MSRATFPTAKRQQTLRPLPSGWMPQRSTSRATWTRNTPSLLAQRDSMDPGRVSHMLCDGLTGFPSPAAVLQHHMPCCSSPCDRLYWLMALTVLQLQADRREFNKPHLSTSTCSCPADHCNPLVHVGVSLHFPPMRHAVLLVPSCLLLVSL